MLLPFQSPFLPFINETYDKYQGEYTHYDQSIYPEFAHRHRPGEEENHFNIKDDEQHRDQIKLHGDAPDSRTNRLHPTFVRCCLTKRRIMRSEYPRDHQYNDA